MCDRIENIKFEYNEEIGEFKLAEEPYAVIECKTEEAFNDFMEIFNLGLKAKKELEEIKND